MAVPELLRQTVIQRADGRCEYCLLSQFAQEATFHIDHIVPRSAGGPTTLENLALACVTCSLRKGARQRAIDPATGLEAPLFHPRRDNWREHFRWDGVALVGLSPIARATIEALKMNRPDILATRLEEQLRGRHPPPGHL
jgi:hypothetical protein